MVFCKHGSTSLQVTEKQVTRNFGKLVLTGLQLSALQRLNCMTDFFFFQRERELLKIAGLLPKAFENEKQPSRGVLMKGYSDNIQQIYRRTPMSKSDFNKVVLQSRCSPVNLLQIFRTPFLRTPLDACFWKMNCRTSNSHELL